ncbi:MAG TPA: TrkA family potassium uptake protein [Roseiflexaceae bacterium]|nr:TrkA family potassium uptake protein [Roseiflexaceae bacterium]
MSILIVGGGKVGGYLAGLLVAAGHQVTLIEARPDHETQLRRALPGVTVVAGDGADPAVLEAAGVRRVQIVAAVTGADETNLVVTSLARLEFGVPRTVARVNDPRNSWLYTPEMGVDVAMNQADVVAHLIAREMA